MGRKEGYGETHMSMNSDAKTMASLFQPKNDFPEPIGATQQVRRHDARGV